MNLSLKSPSRGISVTRPDKSKIDLSHFILGSTNIGWITPLGFKEIVPGDYLKWKINAQIILAPQLRPNFSRMDAYVHKFFVPNRLSMPQVGATYADWDSFIMGDQDGHYANETCPYATIDTTNIQAGFLFYGGVSSYMNLPVVSTSETSTQTININVLPHMGYALIVDEYFRNEWLQERRCGPTTSWDIALGAGVHLWASDLDELNAVQKAYYEHDLLMGCAPTAYSGSDSDVELDLDIDGIVYMETGAGNPVAGAAGFTGTSKKLYDDLGGTPAQLTYVPVSEQTGAGAAVLEIMELRRAEALTRFLEAENRIGDDNMNDWLKSIFGIESSDRRHKTPVYLGGNKIRIETQAITNPGDVLEFDSNDLASPAGYQAGRQYGEGSTEFSTFQSEEYGLIIAVLSVIPRTYYANSIEKFWTKVDDRLSWYNPYFQNIGDEAVMDMEMGYHLDGDNTGTRGYQSRWYEYKHALNYVTGNFISGNATYGLDAFHMGYIHDVTGAAPALNEANCKIDWDDEQNIRIFTYQDGTSEHNVYYQIYHDLNIVRPMYLIDIPK